jgi:hypothetical protein
MAQVCTIENEQTVRLCKLESLLQEIAHRPDIWIGKSLCDQILLQLPGLSEQSE